MITMDRQSLAVSTLVGLGIAAVKWRSTNAKNKINKRHIKINLLRRFPIVLQSKCLSLRSGEREREMGRNSLCSNVLMFRFRSTSNAGKPIHRHCNLMKKRLFDSQWNSFLSKPSKYLSFRVWINYISFLFHQFPALTIHWQQAFERLE